MKFEIIPFSEADEATRRMSKFGGDEDWVILTEWATGYSLAEGGHEWQMIHDLAKRFAICDSCVFRQTKYENQNGHLKVGYWKERLVAITCHA